MTNIDDLKNFNIEDSGVTLWTFKKQTPKDALPKFNGHWIETTDGLDNKLREIVTREIGNIKEEKAYSLLAENNEASALNILSDETHVDMLVDQFAAELPARKIKDVKTIFNANFYVLKFVQDDKILFAARKTDVTWKSRTAKGILSIFFSDARLDIAPNENFRVQKNIDFIGIDGSLFIKNKQNFESILSYKASHEKDYAEMSAENEFVAIFEDLEELTAFIGTNKIHLRRMSAIRQKGFYCDDNFMTNLRNRYKEFGLNIQFDDQGRIIPTLDTCRDIIAALLDHRLSSGFSGNIYDVPDATKV